MKNKDDDILSEKEIELKIAEAFQQDVGYGRVRMDEKSRKELNVSIKDIVEIEGKRKTAATVWRAHPSDEGKGIIRIDNLTRKNAETDLEEKVKVKSTRIKMAEVVIIAPFISKEQEIQFGMGIDELLRKGLLKRPFAKGDIFIVPGIELFGSKLPFQIIDMKPKGIVIITKNTNLDVKEHSSEVYGGKSIGEVFEKERTITRHEENFAVDKKMNDRSIYFHDYINLDEEKSDKLAEEFKQLKIKIYQNQRYFEDIIPKMFQTHSKEDMYRVFLYGKSCFKKGFEEAESDVPRDFIDENTIYRIFKDKNGNIRHIYDGDKITNVGEKDCVVSRIENILRAVKNF